MSIIDRDAAQLEAAEAEVQRLRSTVGKSAEHKRGKISTALADDRKSAIENAWLVVEVGSSLYYVSGTFIGGASDDSADS